MAPRFLDKRPTQGERDLRQKIVEMIAIDVENGARLEVVIEFLEAYCADIRDQVAKDWHELQKPLH